MPIGKHKICLRNNGQTDEQTGMGPSWLVVENTI